jgi:hypothetical protein
LPKGATVYEAENRVNFQTHASRHALSWYEYVLNDGVDISNGSVYFVTECTKSMDWGIAVFYARSMPNHNLRLIFDGGSYQWDYRGKVEARTGSKSTDITVSNGGDPNQCVFLGGYKIMLRPDIWEKLKGATIVTSQDGGWSSPETSRNYSTNYGTLVIQADPFSQSRSDNRYAPDLGHRLRADQLLHTKVLEGGSAKTAETTSKLGHVILQDFFRETAPVRILFPWPRPSSTKPVILVAPF